MPLATATGTALKSGTALEPRTESAWAAWATGATGADLPAVSRPASLAVVHLAMAMMTTVVAAADARSDDESGEEDDCDDEHRPRDDADPGGDDVEPASAGPLLDVALVDDDGCGGGRGLDGTRGRFSGSF